MHRFTFNAEPALIIEFIRQGLLLAVILGWFAMDARAEAAIVSFVSLGLSIFLRQNVVSQQTASDAGTSVRQLKMVSSQDVQAQVELTGPDATMVRERSA